MEPQKGSDLPAHVLVAAEVRACLARQRMSGRRAAFALGWTQQSLSRRLNGEIPFNVTELFALAELLGVDLAEFFPQARGALGTMAMVSRGIMFDKTSAPRYADRVTTGLAVAA